MSRLEYKYLVPDAVIDDLRADIAPFLKLDKFTSCREEKEYTVRSIYLDTPYLSSYNEKLAGLAERAKFRIRTYNEQQAGSRAFLEIKSKCFDFVYKERTNICLNDLVNILESERFKPGSYESFMMDPAVNHFFYHYKNQRLIPVVNVVYDREAFECRFGSPVRVTFDKKIRASVAGTITGLFDESNLKPIFKNCFVLEVKFHKIVPFWVPRIINKYNLSREAISKYTLSVDKNKVNGVFYLHSSFLTEN